MNRSVIIGLDGAPFATVERWAAKGILPHLQGLMKNGTFGPFLSTPLPETPIAWTSIVTGKNAGKHGVFDWGERVNGSYEIGISLSTSCKEPKLWEIIGHMGKRSGIFNVPLTYPPQTVEGFLVSGFDTPGTNVCFTCPPSLSEEILSQVKGYILFVQEAYTQGKEEEYVKGLIASLEQKERAALYLIDRYDTDFSLYVFMELDHLHHKLWRWMEMDGSEEQRLAQEVYRRMDETVGKIVGRFDEETTFFVISDHGAGPLEGKMYINKWLMEMGWLKLKKRPSLLFKNLLSRTNLVPKAYRLLTQLGLGWLGKILPRSLQYHLATSFISFKDVDWEETKAYAYGKYGQIFVNLQSREPQGTVKSGREYEQLLKQIGQSLLEIVHPETGKKMIEKVFRKEELYQGPMLEKAPDLSFSIDSLRYDSSVNFGFGLKGIFGPPEFEDSGTHRREGILIASGKGIRKGSHIDGATLVDIAPTALYSLDLPIPMDMDGRVLKNLFEEDWVKAHPVRFGERQAESISSDAGKGLSPEESEIVKKKLRSLGYLD
jgi:predicted AlkP superfamily phosphohydrolase/phosphomutase